MKNILVIIFAVAAIVFASLYYFQSDKIALYKDVIYELEQSADKIPAFESAMARLKADKVHFEQENEQLKQQIENHENKIAALQNKTNSIKMLSGNNDKGSFKKAVDNIKNQ